MKYANLWSYVDLTALCVFIILISISCAPEEQPSQGSGLSAILGRDNRTVVDSSDSMNMIVGGVGQEKMPFCTAFKIETNEYVTARHCVVDEKGDTLDSLTFITPVEGKAYPIQEFTRFNEKADLAFFKVEGYNNGAKLELANATTMSTELSVYSVVSDESSHYKVQLMTDRNCKFLRQDLTTGLMIHQCDTLHGSSGSPILDGGKVVGVHLGAMNQVDQNDDQVTQTVNVASTLRTLDQIDVTRATYEQERCSCSLRCPGRCKLKDIVPDPFEAVKKVAVGLLAKPTAAAVKPTAERQGWSLVSCAVVGYAPIHLASLAYQVPICATFNVAAAACVGFVEASTAEVVSSVCGLLCASHSLEGCK